MLLILVPAFALAVLAVYLLAGVIDSMNDPKRGRRRYARASTTAAPVESYRDVLAQSGAHFTDTPREVGKPAEPDVDGS